MAHTAKLAFSYRPVDAIVPYGKNARTHSPAQIDQIVASIKEFGWTNPILADGKNGVLAGHGRLLAAKQMGLAEVPVIDLAGLTAAQKRAYIIADNRLALNAGWDEELLAAELKALEADGFDLGLAGFDEAEIAHLLAPEGLTDPDDAPAPVVDPVVRTGDLWHLGHHRLLIGDCTKAADVARLLGDRKPHLMVTDPPYGVNYDPDWRNRADRANGKPYGASAIGRVNNDDRADWREAYVLFPGDVAYVWHPPGARQVEFFNSLVACGFNIRMQIIWAKQQFPIGRGNYHVQHEPCWYCVREGKTAHWQGSRKESTLWAIDKPVKSETGHSTQKPVECMRRPILNNSKAGDWVYDPFVGSGTSIIACEMEGRKCLALEISPTYGQVCIERFQAFAGKDALLDGKTPFSAILAKRTPKAKK